MENSTKLHENFTKKLNDLIEGFNSDNPDLFIRDIDITYAEQGNGQKFYTGIRVDIVVQPCT